MGNVKFFSGGPVRLACSLQLGDPGGRDTEQQNPPLDVFIRVFNKQELPEELQMHPGLYGSFIKQSNGRQLCLFL